jgi:tetratricopeptide (TPR) repeat protein
MLVVLLLGWLIVSAQQTPGGAARGLVSVQGSSPAESAAAAFKAGNELMEQHKPAEALRRYQESLTSEPKDTSVLFNAGLAAFLSKDFVVAADLWTRLKVLDADDWRARAKLVQAYQALGRTTEREVERAELFALWKSGKNEDLSKQSEYCREQLEVNGTRLMVFEHFEFKGERPVRYVFDVLKDDGKASGNSYSLGSYEATNRMWHETMKPRPKKEERLFHLDGYFPNGHATYAMIAGEPSYDETRDMVMKIVAGQLKPASSSTWASPPAADPKPE